MLKKNVTMGPFAVEETEHLWIEMADGTRLAARLWRPVTDQPVPALLEYIPYRKADMVRARDERNHPFFAANGYACIRVDMRGSGDSEGQMPDMYADAELSDARAVIDWLAAQPWCDGKVGMFGTSWGGTASLQASVDAPAALKAVIAVCATHDRFEDDIHYMGGCVLTDTFEWGATLPAILGAPPTSNAGGDWMDLWRKRLKDLACPVENWLRADARGTYWRHGSVIHNARALSVPILSVGGWSDRYSNSVMALVNARPDKVWGMIGPWGHHYPDQGSPGPAIGFQHLALEWWDHWLKAKQPSHPSWPRLRVWLREFEQQKDVLQHRKGRWIESGPTSTETQIQVAALGGGLKTQQAGPWQVPSDPGIGTTSGDTGYFGRSGGLPLDQDADDARSLVFETTPLDNDLVIFGAPTLTLKGHAATGRGTIAARLNDVSETGEAARIAYGVRNIALDKDLDRPAKSQQQGTFNVDIRLHSTAYLIRKGHRLRVALTQAMWPLVLGDLQSSEITVLEGEVALPRLTYPPTPLFQPFPAPMHLPVKKSYQVTQNPPLRRWQSRAETAEVVGWQQPLTAVHYPETETTFAYDTCMEHELETGQHPVLTTRVSHEMQFIRPDGTAVIATTLESRKSAQQWTVSVSFSANWLGEEIAAKNWLIEPAI